MFRFTLGVVISLTLCLRFSLAGEPFLVQDGDYYPSLTVPADGLEMTGGRIDELIVNIVGGFPGPFTTVNGGSVGSIQLESGNLVLAGGHIGQPVNVGAATTRGFPWTVTIEASHIRFDKDVLFQSNPWVFQGWFRDNTYFDLRFLHAETTIDPNFAASMQAQISVVGDADHDCDVDLDDLNVVRNNFGSIGPGDLNGNNIVNLQDLRIVRHNFNIAPFTIPSRWGVGTCYTAVPEPSGVFLLSTLILSVLLARVGRQIIVQLKNALRQRLDEA